MSERPVGGSSAQGPPEQTSAICHLVLSRDGTILAATGPALASWIGARLEECADAPADLKEAGRDALCRATHGTSPTPIVVSLESISEPVCLSVVDAVPIRRSQTDLRHLLRQSLEILQRQARACDVALVLQLDDRLPAALSLDAQKIAWATTMLVGNALRYVPRGSQVNPGGSIVVRAAYHAEASEITLEVQDDGPGMSADTVRSLFSAAPDRPHVGLGLMMVRDVVAAHGGHLEVESNPEAFRGGTTVRLTLPVE